MFCHPAWALGSFSSGPRAAKSVGTKSMRGFYLSDGSPCSLHWKLQTTDSQTGVVKTSVCSHFRKAPFYLFLPLGGVKKWQFQALLLASNNMPPIIYPAAETFHGGPVEFGLGNATEWLEIGLKRSVFIWNTIFCTPVGHFVLYSLQRRTYLLSTRQSLGAI